MEEVQEKMKREKAELTLTEKVLKNREELKKQDAWAYSVAKKEFMNQVVLEEHHYGDGERERVDFLFPKQRKAGKLPIFFYIHGGWIAGNKEERRVYCGKFADSGYFVANIEYELAPETHFPTAIGQCIRAIDYVLAHAEEYQLDTNKIAVGGESAGVYYAVFVSAIAKDKTILERLRLPQMKHPEFDVKVNMFNCGTVDFKLMAEKGFPGVDIMLEAYTGYPYEKIKAGDYDEELREILPLTYINEKFPPTFLIYGSLDSLRFNTFRMIEVLEKYGVKHKVYKGTGLFYGQHTTAMILKDKKAFRIFDETVAYMNTVLGC